MNNHTPTHTHTANRTRGLLMVVPALLSIALLAGCAPEVGLANTPSSTPVPAPPSSTPTADSSPSATPDEIPGGAPATEEVAVDGAEQAIADFLRIRGEVDSSGGVDTAPLEAISSGAALEVALGSARRVVELNWTTTGQLVFEPTQGYATDAQAVDGTTIPFGGAFITGCQDGKSYLVTNADGTPANTPARNELEFTVLWNTLENKWLVDNVIATGQTC
jgi:hypothetical protein